MKRFQCLSFATILAFAAILVAGLMTVSVAEAQQCNVQSNSVSSAAALQQQAALQLQLQALQARPLATTSASAVAAPAPQLRTVYVQAPVAVQAPVQTYALQAPLLAAPVAANTTASASASAVPPPQVSQLTLLQAPLLAANNNCASGSCSRSRSRVFSGSLGGGLRTRLSGGSFSRSVAVTRTN